MGSSQSKKNSRRIGSVDLASQRQLDLYHGQQIQEAANLADALRSGYANIDLHSVELDNHKSYQQHQLTSSYYLEQAHYMQQQQPLDWQSASCKQPLASGQQRARKACRRRAHNPPLLARQPLQQLHQQHPEQMLHQTVQQGSRPRRQRAGQRYLISHKPPPSSAHYYATSCEDLYYENPKLSAGYDIPPPSSTIQTNYEQHQHQNHPQHSEDLLRLSNQSPFGGSREEVLSKMDFKFQHQQQPQHLLNQRGLSLSKEERLKLGLLGHLPAAQQTLDTQIKWVLNYLDNNCFPQDQLAKFVFLRNLKDFDERLFYASLMRHVEKLMPIVYTPTVGLACQRFSEIYLRPRGLFITLDDLGRVSELLSLWPEQDVRVIVVTDGERILGLGDLGANGMGICIGKLSLYTALAGVPPRNVLPITIDAGTDNQSLLESPFYIGMRQKRTRGPQYDALVEEFMRSVVARWGRSCLIQFEDFGNHNAFRLLQSYRKLYCTFNDDIQGTASVCLSGLLSATRLIGRRLSDCQFLFYGAGEANLGTAELLELAMTEDGLTRSEALDRIWLVDSKGLVVSSRNDLPDAKRRYARESPHLTSLIEIVAHSKASAIIGASAQPDAFNEQICRRMAEINERPIIFALSNPTSKAECTAEQAYEWTGGRCIFASGSPFEPFTYKGRSVATGQGNNAYIFPAVGLAAIAAHLYTIPTETFLVAARALSDQLTAEDTNLGLVYPSLTRIREVTLAISTRVLEYFFSERLATYRPEPSDKLSFLKSIQYDPFC